MLMYSENSLSLQKYKTKVTFAIPNYYRKCVKMEFIQG